MAVNARRRSDRDQESFPLARFFREVLDELRKVVWPTPAELYRYTLVVVATVVTLGLFIGAVDYGVGEVVRRWIYAGLAH